MNPNVYIIAGPNGAGKTTFARKFLPNYADCRNFINADLIAQGLSPLAPETAAFRAGRLMLNEIEFQANRGADFGFETTLSGRGHLKLIRGLKDRGYQVHFFFIGLLSVELALSRIRQRVSKGGHNVRESDVRRRFGRSGRNFFGHYRPLASSWFLFDNSAGAPTLIALEQQGKVRIIEHESYDTLVLRYGKLG